MSTPLFSKRHYEWLAAFARAELPTGDRIALCNALDRTNANFNRDRFEHASGIAEYLAGRAALVRSSRPLELSQRQLTKALHDLKQRMREV